MQNLYPPSPSRPTRKVYPWIPQRRKGEEFYTPTPLAFLAFHPDDVPRTHEDWIDYVIRREQSRTAIAIRLGIRQGRRNDDPDPFSSSGTR
jgi:hypothetical protein